MTRLARLSFIANCRLLFLAILGFIGVATTANEAHAQIYWGNTATAWGTNTSWAGGVAPTSAQVAGFNTGTYTFNPVVSANSVLGLQFDNTSGAITISGTGLTIGTSGILDNSLGATSISSTVTLAGAQTWTNNSATSLTVSGAITDGGFLLTTAGTGNISVGLLSGAGGLTQSGTGTLTLSSAANTYTGATTISSGTISVGNVVVASGASGLGNATSAVILGSTTTKGTLSYSGSTASYTRGFTINAGGGEVDVTTSGQTLTLGSPLNLTTGPLTLGGAGNFAVSLAAVVPFTGTNAFTKAGAGTLTVTTTGVTAITASAMPINVSGGTFALSFANNAITNPLGTGAITITPGATLTFTQAGQNGNTYGNSSITIANTTGTATIQSTSGAVPFTSPVSFTAGASTPTFQIKNTNGTAGLMTFSGGFTGTGNIQLNGTGTNGATITISGTTVNNVGTISNIGTGSGSTATISATIGSNVTSVTQAGASPFTISSPFALSATNDTLTSTGSGLWTFSGGLSGTFPLILNANSTGGITIATTTVNNAGSITNSGTSSGQATISSVIGTSVTGVIENSATSMLNLSGANTFTGGVTITSGKVVTSTSAAALGTGTVLLGATSGSSSATLDSGATALTFANPITVQAGSSGTNTLSFTGANANIVTYSGAITLNGNLTLNNASTSTGRLALGGIISGPGSLTYNGTGTGDFTPTAANTYTGGTTVNAGALIAVSVSSVGTAGSPTSGPFGAGSAPLVLNGSAMRSGTGGPFTIANTVTLSGNSSFYTIANEKSLIFSGPVTLSGGTRTITSTLGTSVAGTSVVFNGAIGDGGNALSLITSGAGNITFNAANTYTGTTTITAGALILGSTGSLANPTITAQTGGTFQFFGSNTFSGTSTPVITIAGNTTPATAGTLSLFDGSFNTVTINTATPATPALVLGGAAGSPANLAFEIGTAGSDNLTLGSGVQATVNPGGALVTITALSSLYNGSAKVVLTSPTTDLTAGGPIALSTTTGNWGGYDLTLITTPTAVTITGTPHAFTAPTTAYFKGSIDNAWNSFSGGSAFNTNFTADAAGTTNTGVLPTGATDVHFFATGTTTANLATVLNQNFTIKTLTLDATATTAVSIASGVAGSTLTITPASATTGITIASAASALTITAPVTLGASQTWTNNSANTLAVSGVISGTGSSLTISNTSTGGTTISGANTFDTGLTLNSSGTGVLTISDSTNYVGNVNITNDGFGSGTITLTAGTLNLRANGDGTTSAQTLTYNNPLVINGTVTINADYQAAAGGTGKTLAFPSTSIGANTLSATGNSHAYTLSLGNVTLNATAGGTTTIGSASSTLWLTAASVTGSATAGNTDTLALGGIIGTVGSAISGVIADGSGGGNVALLANTAAFWALTGSSSNTFTGGTIVKLSGTTVGAGLTLAKTGGAIAIPGNLTIGDASTTPAHVYLAGTNEISSTAALTFNGVNTGFAYLHLQGNSQTIGSVAETSPGFAVIETRETAGTYGTSTITFNVASGTQSYQGYFRDVSTGTDTTNSLALVKSGAGTLRFGAASNGTGSAALNAAAHNYTGGTTILNGTLQIATASGTAANLSIVGTLGVTIDGGASFAGTLDINGLATGLTGLNGVTGTVLGQVVNNATATTAALTVGNNNTSGSFAGLIENNNNAGTGVLALTKTGTGTQSLLAANTYTGTTTISGGTLSLAGGTIAGSNVSLGVATFQILNDGTGSNGTIAIGNNVALTAATATINVNNNGSANTGNTIALGALTSPTTATIVNLTVTGGNGYNVSFTNFAMTGTTGNNQTLTPTGANININGNVTNQMSGFATTNYDTLMLDGTTTGNLISGVISDAVGGSFANPLLGGYTRLYKQNSSTWTISGANTYTGITLVTNGTLKAGANNVIGALNLQGIQVAATNAGITATFDFNGFNQTLNGTTAFTLSGTTTTSTPQVLGSGSTVTINGGVTYTSTNNPKGGLISISTLDLGAGSRTFNVGLSTSAGTLALPDLTVSSTLQDGTLVKTGAGVLLLTGALNLTQVQDTAGTIGITSATTLNSTNVLVNGGTFDLGGTTQNGSNFTYVSGTIQNGTLTTTNFLKQGPGTLTLAIAVAVSTVTINQGLASTTSNPATPSTVNLNFAAAGAPSQDMFTNTSSLTLGGSAQGLLGGGELSLTGAPSATNSQTFASTLIAGGASYLVATIGTAGTVNLNLGTLTRSVAGTLDITLPATGTVTQASPGTAGTILTSAAGTAYATVGGDSWAANSTLAPGSIVSAATAGAGGASIYTTASTAGTFSGNADITASFTATSGSTVNSIRFNTGSFTLTLAGTNTVSTGGLLFGSGITAATITGGTIVPGAGQELVFISNKPNVSISIASVLADGSGGPTAVTYRGNPNGGTTGSSFTIGSNNTYTGPTYITNGRVGVTAGTLTTPFGTGANAIVSIDGSADGQFFDSINSTIATPFVIVGNGFNIAGVRGGAIRLDSTATLTPTLSGTITLVGDSSIGNNAAISTGYGVISGNIGTSNAQGATSFALTKVLTGDLKLTGTNSQTATNIAAGLLNINADAALGATGAPLTFTGAGTLQFNNSGIVLAATRSIVLNAAASFDTLTLTAAQPTYINGVISGTGSLTKAYTASATQTAYSPLVLAGNNTFTGAVTATNGVITLTNSNSLGLGTKTVTATNGTAGFPEIWLDPSLGATPGANISLPSTISFVLSNTADGTATGGSIVNNSGNNTIAGTITNTSGGGGAVLTSNAGSITFTGNFTASQTARALYFRGASTIVYSGIISNGSTVDLPVFRDQGAGTATLSGANTYTGLTTVNAGTIKLGNAQALGTPGTIGFATGAAGSASDDNGTTIASGAALDLGGQTNINEVIRISGTGVGGTGALTNSSSTLASIGTGTGTSSLASLKASTSAGITISGTTSISFAGGGAGSGAAATPVFGVTAASFTIAGGTTVYSGAPSVTIGGNSGGIAATATATLTAGIVSSITITNEGTGFTGTPTITFSNGTVMTPGTNPTGTGNNTNFAFNGITVTNVGSGYTAPLTATLNNASGATLTAILASVVMTGNSSIGGSGDITLNGTLDESGGSRTFTKVGTDTLTLNGPNTYSGRTIITSGTLAFNSIGTVGSGSTALGAPTSAANGTIGLGTGSTDATLQYTGSANISTDRVIDLGGSTGNAILSNTGTGTITFTSNLTTSGIGVKTLILTGTNTGANTIGGSIPDNGAASPSTFLTKSGVGTWVLTGTNTFTGTITLSGGVLQTDTAGINGADTTSGLTFAGGTLKANTAAGITTAKAITATSNILLDATNGPIALSGNIAPTTSGFSFLGGNDVTLSGTNSYTGPTTVTSGTLHINGDHTNATGTVTVSGGALRGVGIIGGNVQVTSGGTIKAGNTAAGTLTLLAGLSVAPGGTFGLQIVDGSTPSTGTPGSSTDLVNLPNPTRNSFYNFNGGTVTIDPAALINVDATVGTYAPGATYSYQVASGAGNQSALNVPDSQFSFTGIAEQPGSASLTGDASGDIFLNFTTSSVPEPTALLGLATLSFGLSLLRRRGR